MKVKRFSEAKSYEAPHHRNYTSLRLIGPEEGVKNFTIALSHFLPGGGAGPDSSPLEKTYTILSGELTVISDGKEVVLKPWDSCYIGPDVTREIVNRGNAVVTMLVALSTSK